MKLDKYRSGKKRPHASTLADRSPAVGRLVCLDRANGDENPGSGAAGAPSCRFRRTARHRRLPLQHHDFALHRNAVSLPVAFAQGSPSCRCPEAWTAPC